jgi:thiol-disulfide isomerase/thioredoxin
MKLLARTLIALLAATPVAAAAPLRAIAIESPAAVGSAEPFVAARGGRLHLTWLQEAPEGAMVLRTATLAGGIWSTPATIAAGKSLLANWVDFPSLLPLPDGSLVAHWLDRTTAEGEAYDIRVARSRDGGATWSAPLTPHRDGTQTEHGFVSLVEVGGERALAVWLDGRAYAEAASLGAGGGKTALRAAVLEGDRFGAETVLDPRVCDCCQTSAASTPHGIFVAYRDRSEAEVRDISYVRFVGGRWTEPRTLHADGWEISACPVNGPAVAARGDRLAVAWFTAAKPGAAGAAGSAPTSGGRVMLALSPDGGESFAAPLRIDAGNPVGRVDVEWLDDGTAVVVWNEHGEGETAQVQARAIGVDGALEPALTVARILGGRGSGFPRLAPYQDGVAVAWTDPGDRPRVRLARLTRDSKALGAPPAAPALSKPVPLPPLENRPAPQFKGRALDGKPVDLVNLRGKVVLLNFWGTWCPPCREEIPELMRFHHDLHDKGLEIVSVNVGDSKARLMQFADEQKIPYVILVQDSLTHRYRVTSFPTSVVIDQQGQIRYVAEGYSSRAIPDLRRIVEHLLEGGQ